MPRFDDETVADLVNLATTDWMSIGALSGVVGRILGDEARVEAIAEAIGELAGLLIDRGAVPGDLGADPDFQPWPGTRAERVDRIVREARQGDGYPWPGEIAWFHRQPEDAPAP